MNSSLKSKTSLAALACIAACILPVSAAHAQAYPSKPIRCIMAIAGGADIVARLVAQGLSVSMGQPVVVETQAGAGGAVGADMVARAAPDGYTFMLASSSTQVMNRFLSKSARLDPVKDFTALTKAFETVLLLVINPSLPVNSVSELIDYAKRNPGKLSYGTSGIGTSHHLAGEEIKLITGIDWVHVPYKGGPPVITDLISGQIQVGFTILATAGPYMNSGKMKILAVNNNNRYPVIPNIPATGEQIPGYDAPPAWSGYFGPAGMAQPVARRLHDELVKALNQPEVKSKAQDIGFVIETGSPEDLIKTIQKDVVVVGKIVKAVGIQPE
jgi:tripartite-type tricarboxylate transporter receptor subunit TctC